MRIGIIACETFRRELEMLVQGDEDIAHKEYLEFGLHEYPEELKKAVVDKVNSLEGKVDAVFLGYGICQSLKDITKKMRVPTVQLKEDDCIGALITSEEYERERKVCAGTMFHTPAFCEMGEAWFEKDMQKKMTEEQLKEFHEQGYDTMWFLRTLFNGYSRTLFIDTGVGDREHYLALSREFAAKLDMRHESRDGTLEVIKDALRRTKELAEAR
jgi:hypothetical protein